jgi:hypothetical protein
MKRTTVLALILFNLIALGAIAVQPSKASAKTITVPDDYPTITAAINNAANGDTI